MEYPFHKFKIPKGYSYPLKRSVLDAWLETTGLTQLAGVSYVFFQHSDNLVIRALFTGETIKYRTAGTYQVWIYAVPSAEKSAIEQLIMTEALPILGDWLMAAEKAGNSWRGKSHHLEISYLNGRLAATHS